MIYETGKKTCDRCNKPYQHELDGSQPNENGCEYHPGRFQRKQSEFIFVSTADYLNSYSELTRRIQGLHF